MAAASLLPAVLSLAEDPSKAVASYTADWRELASTAGEVRVMANGRRRIVRRAGSSRSLGWTMRMLTKEQVATVKEWAGRTVLIRDAQGRKEYGVFFDVAVVDYKARDVHDVTLSLESVTFSEFA